MGRTNDRTPTLLAEAARKIQLHFEFIITVCSTIGLSALSLLFTAIPRLPPLLPLLPLGWEHYPVRSSAEIGLANRDTDREAPTHRGRNKEGEEGRGGEEWRGPRLFD